MKNHLPVSAKIALLINGGMGLVAFFILGIGVVVGSNVLDDFDLQATIYLSGKTKQGKGVISDIYETGVSINDETVLAYEYTFDSPIGPLQWTSYSHNHYYEIGDEVTVEYSEDHPSVHKISGMSTSSGGFLSLLMVIPFVVGVVWIVINLRKGTKRIRIIESGVITTGRLIDKESTGAEVNDRTVYKLTFEFQSDDGKTHHAYARTHKTRKLEDEKNEVIIYNPMKPENSLLADDTPWHVPGIIKKFVSK